MHHRNTSQRICRCSCSFRLPAKNARVPHPSSALRWVGSRLPIYPRAFAFLRSSNLTPRHRLSLAALYLSTTLAAHAQPNPNLMKYACGPANRMFATLSPTSRYTDTTAGFDLVPPPQFKTKPALATNPSSSPSLSPRATIASPSSSAAPRPPSPPCAPKAVASCSKRSPPSPTPPPHSASTPTSAIPKLPAPPPPR